MSGRPQVRTIVVVVVALIGIASIAAWRITSNRGTKVTAEQFGDQWPLTIPIAYISCSGPSVTVVRTPNGKAYALTGIGESQGLPSLLPIRKHDPSIPEMYVSKSALIQAAQKLCK